MTDARTIAAYDHQAAEYAELAKTDEAQQGLDSFLRLVRSGGLILDLGCGPGHTAAKMVKLGYCVDAIDASPEMARLAWEQYQLEVRLCDFAAINVLDHYDGVWASFSLLHAPREQFPLLIDQVARALKPEGALFIGMKLGEGSGRDRLGRHYSYFSEDELVDTLSASGFMIRNHTSGEGLGLAGHVEPWMTLIAVKTG